MNVLDLFSGIGGFTLGLERTGGFRTVAFCEQEDFCRRVLNRHYPNVPVFPDVRLLTRDDLDLYDLPRIDVICGGFPCQDISLAGKGAGLTGERSGLWFEYARIIEEVRPSWVIIENVAALRSRGLDQVLGSLAAIGYDAEWHCIPASAVGAPHRRDRVWIIAYPRGEQYEGRSSEDARSRASQLPETPSGNVSDSDDGRRRGEVQSLRLRECSDTADARSNGEVWPLADADFVTRDERGKSNAEQGEGRGNADRSGKRSDVSNADSESELTISIHAEMESTRSLQGSGWWAVEPDVGRVADGVPARVDRLRSLGNAIVPQIAEVIGHAILRAHRFS